ncbi:Receptor protein 12 [Spatholobus suberectus]|nr:Receptor protein 12 [Spatholobus suberectus]
MCCEGCWKEERKALLVLNSRLGHLFPWIDSSDCCQWEQVECNTTTGRVAKLDLRASYGINVINFSDFVVFKDLKSLDLTAIGISGCAENGGLENLEFLDLSANRLDNAASILSCLDGLSSLKFLYLAWNSFNASSFHENDGFAWPTDLQVLRLRDNKFSDKILSSLSGLRYLKFLDLSFNQLEGSLDISVDKRTHIKYNILMANGKLGQIRHPTPKPLYHSIPSPQHQTPPSPYTTGNPSLSQVDGGKTSPVTGGGVLPSHRALSETLGEGGVWCCGEKSEGSGREVENRKLGFNL